MYHLLTSVINDHLMIILNIGHFICADLNLLNVYDNKHCTYIVGPVHFSVFIIQ